MVSIDSGNSQPEKSPDSQERPMRLASPIWSLLVSIIKRDPYTRDNETKFYGHDTSVQKCVKIVKTLHVIYIFNFSLLVEECLLVSPLLNEN